MALPTETLSVELPAELVRLVRDRVASGRYGSQSDLVRQGLQDLLDREDGVERWLKTEVASTFDAHASGSSTVVSADTVRAGLRQRFAASRTTE